MAYYAVKKFVKIQVGSSKSGIGAVMLQDDRAIAYVSKCLTETQQKYAPVVQEILAVAFGCQRFHQYTYI